MLTTTEAPNLFYSFALQVIAMVVAGVLGLVVYGVLGRGSKGSQPKIRK